LAGHHCDAERQSAVGDALCWPGTQCGSRRKAEPDWTTRVHHELRRPDVTLMLLWEEYQQREPGGYGYSRWCELYRAWEGLLQPAPPRHGTGRSTRNSRTRRAPARYSSHSSAKVTSGRRSSRCTEAQSGIGR
jgi:hypothetical protein